jgi:hypothetical protein
LGTIPRADVLTTLVYHNPYLMYLSLIIIHIWCVYCLRITYHESVSRRWNILCTCIMFKIIASFITTLFAWLYDKSDILLTCWKLLHDNIISQIREVHKISLSSPLFIEVPVKWNVMYNCVMIFTSFYSFSIIGIWTRSVPTVWYI